MKKKLLIMFAGVMALICLSGCSKNDNTTTMTAYTSTYPIEYLLESLYGKNTAIYSIYPDGINYKNYKLTNKQLEDYGKADLFVYNSSINNEKNYAVKMLNKNKNLKIIDASQGMTINNDVSEAWLNPANYLMMASNIKKGLKEYVSEKIEMKAINKNYSKLKLNLSSIDAELKEAATNANNPTIVVMDDSFKYLEKYGFIVYSLQDGENLTDKNLSEIRKLMYNKTIKYIFVKDNQEDNDLVKELKNSYGVTTVSLNSLSTMNAEDRKDKKDYISIMEDNINSIKLEVNE